MSPVTLRGIALLAVSTVVVVGGFLLWPFGPEISDEDYKIAVPASESVKLPQLLLPDASKQMQYRRRIVDPVTQIAHDEILLKSGFTQIVTVFNTANGACLNELTYYPVAREQDYSAEAKKATQSAPVVAVQPLDMHPAPHGALYRERTCSVSGLGTASEVIYDRNGKVTAKSELFAEGLSRYHYKTEIFNVLGKVATSQLRNLTGGLVEETQYDLNGVRTSLRKSPSATLNSWDAFQYQPDGVTMRVQESRSYGNYSVIHYHPDGKTIAERSAVTTSGATLDTYRADGKQIKSIDKRKWGCDVVITDYGVNGLPLIERHLDTYCIKDNPYSLAEVTVHDGDGLPIRKYVFDRKQQLASVEIRLPATEADKGIRPEGYRKPLKDDKPADVWVVYNLRDIVLDSKQVVINKVKSDLMKPDADIGRPGDLNAAGRKALVMLDKAWYSQAELAPIEAEKVDVSAERQTHPY